MSVKRVDNVIAMTLKVQKDSKREGIDNKEICDNDNQRFDCAPKTLDSVYSLSLISQYIVLNKWI